MFRAGGGSLRFRRHTRRMIRSGWRPSSGFNHSSGERMRSGGRTTIRVRRK
jgi:hypothetical protein